MATTIITYYYYYCAYMTSVQSIGTDKDKKSMKVAINVKCQIDASPASFVYMPQHLYS